MRVCGVSSRREGAKRASLSGKGVFWTVAALLLAGSFQWVLCAAPPVETVPYVPPGTVFPLTLDDAVAVSSVQARQKIEARIAQEVRLSGKEKISLRSRVVATVVSIDRSAEGPATLSLKFDQLEEKGETFAITTDVRAMASYRAVRNAQMPLTGADAGTPAGWGTTVQIGGDQRFGDGGKVRNRQKQTVGKGVRGGVLVHLSANPAKGCDGPHPGDRPQATWVFSADACGVYDLQGVKITHTGRSDPVGVITLEFEKGDMKLESGTAFLLDTLMKP